MKLSKAECKLAVYLLKLASNEFSNHGCNELKLISDVKLTQEEMKEIQLKIKRWTKDPEFENDSEYAYDWMAMSYLADLIKGMMAQ